jgi:hypothetical protein
MDFDPRDRDDDAREIEMPWVELRSPDREHGEVAFVDDRDRDRDERGGDPDPRDPFLQGLELPRGRDREIVMDGAHRYELNGEDSRTLATVGAFRVVAERDLRDPREESNDWRAPDLRHLRDEGLIRSVSLDGREQAVTLSKGGHHLLVAHRGDRDDAREQTFYAGVSRPREMSHDAQLYRAYLGEEERLREHGAEIRRVVLDQALKREYQEWLQESNRGRTDSDGRPDRDPREIEGWAHEHDLPYFDEQVHFPDFRIEYELDGRDRHEGSKRAAGTRRRSHGLRLH